jgi:eukaryotic-like serine/threonine-protein kinase
MSLICCVLNRSSVLAFPRTAPTCSKYPTPLLNSTTTFTGTSAWPSFFVHETIGVFIQVAQGLAALHGAGFIHCDLKPGNVLVNDAGQAKVIDFGQACGPGTVKERIQGTPDFISPEQVKCQPVTARTDVFNLGATMYWTLARRSIPTLYTLNRGENSFLVDDRIASPREIDPKVPEPVSNLVMECVRTNPEKRPADMKELARRLEIVEFAARRSAVA